MKSLINKIKWFLKYYRYMYLVNSGKIDIDEVPITYRTSDMYMVYVNRDDIY